MTLPSAKRNPWLSIWIHPRETMNQIANAPLSYRFIVLASIYVFPWLMQMSQTLGFGAAQSSLWIVVLCLVLSVPFGSICLVLGSVLLWWTGQWIGGCGSLRAVRAAMAWSYIPNSVNGFIWLALAGVFGASLFSPSFGHQLAGPDRQVIFLAAGLQIMIFIWCIVLFLISLAQVQQFSIWKAILNLFLSTFVGAGLWIGFWIVMGICSWLVEVFSGAR